VKKFQEGKQLCFDDILMVPQYADIESRSEINLRMTIGRAETAHAMSLPIIAAPMDTVCESEMAVAMRDNGGLGIIHRYNSLEKQVKEAKKTSEKQIAFGAAVGARGDYLDRAYQLVLAGASMILIDTANGHSEYTIKAVSNLRKLIGRKIHIMAGNVSTYDGFARLSDAGANSVRVGIGGGSVCTTRIMTGHGVPTLASVMSIKSKIQNNCPTSIIADGGIRNSGDALKAFAAGADAIMLGSKLAGCEEAPGTIYINENGRFKTFRGMASREAQQDAFGRVSVAEGVSTMVKYTGKVSETLNEFRGGLASGCSYTGVTSLKELYSEAMYVEVTPLSLNESKPHGKYKGK
jgi:IMP dehydrogenase